MAPTLKPVRVRQRAAHTRNRNQSPEPRALKWDASLACVSTRRSEHALQHRARQRIAAREHGKEESARHPGSGRQTPRRNMRPGLRCAGVLCAPAHCVSKARPEQHARELAHRAARTGALCAASPSACAHPWGPMRAHASSPPSSPYLRTLPTPVSGVKRQGLNLLGATDCFCLGK